MKSVIRASVCAVGLMMAVSSAQADPILYVSDGSGRLGKVDVATGGVSFIGNTGVVMTDIAFDPSGNLYGVSFTDLYSIDKSTAAISHIGSHGISGGNALVFGADGTLYAAGAVSSLYTLNTTTGASTNIGSTGFSSGGDLAFNGGDLYLATTNSLVRVGLSPVSGTFVGSFGFSNVFGLATGDDGVLYGVSGTAVFSINTATGLGTFESNYGGHGLGAAFGSAFFREAGAGVPEPTSVGLMGLGLASLGLWRRRC